MRIPPAPGPMSVLVLILFAALTPLSPALADDDFFDVTSIPSKGRSVAAELADLNGDGRTDLMVVTLDGIPPRDSRMVRVFYQRVDGSLPSVADFSRPLPAWAAVYDVADVKEPPGEELLLLRPDRVTILSLSNADGEVWDLVAPGPTTVATSDDERGLEPFQLVFHDFGPEPWILVPQIGKLLALDVDGGVLAHLELPRRTNFFVIPKASFISVESDAQLFLDVPKIAVTDVDGDGLADISASTRHELRVFLQKPGGQFDAAASRSIPLNLVTPRDHIRGSGGVVCLVEDANGDGLADLMVSHSQGGFSDAKTTTYIYLNREGRWDLRNPDTLLEDDSSLSSNVFVDLDSDGMKELVRVRLDFSLLEFVEVLLTQELDAILTIHRFDGQSSYAQKPWRKRKVSIPISFETFRPRGFLPPAGIDLTGDGFVDFVRSDGGDAIEIFAGNQKEPFRKRTARQEMPTAGVAHFEDFDGDGFLDFLLFDPHNFDVPVRIAINRTGPGARMSAAPD